MNVANELNSEFHHWRCHMALIHQVKTASNLLMSIREIQVAGLWLCGKSAKETALILRISNRTVETHRLNVKEKFGAANKSQLFELFYKYELHILLINFGGKYLKEH